MNDIYEDYFFTFLDTKYLYNLDLVETHSLTGDPTKSNTKKCETMKSLITFLSLSGVSMNVFVLVKIVISLNFSYILSKTFIYEHSLKKLSMNYEL